jgi:hypothetical protein
MSLYNLSGLRARAQMAVQQERLSVAAVILCEQQAELDKMFVKNIQNGHFKAGILKQTDSEPFYVVFIQNHLRV